jgi:DGQHR domain-containing protein
MPSDVLARTCFVTTRHEDPKEGFQRLLDLDRAKEIAHYIDEGLGTIPSSVVLSAQPEAQVKVIGRGKTIQFLDTQKAFLILDGQHRVYGFRLARTALRVPVVVYNGLSRKDESRLFIDINTKQRPVSNELLLDIKKLAEYETDAEQLLGAVFDLFNEDPNSPLLGLLSSAKKVTGKISRVTFYAAFKPLLPAFDGSDPESVFDATRAYLAAFITCLNDSKIEDAVAKPSVLRAIMLLFNEVGQRVKLKHGQKYTVDNFHEVLEPMFTRVKPSMFKGGGSYKEIYSDLSKALRTDFTL